MHILYIYIYIYILCTHICILTMGRYSETFSAFPIDTRRKLNVQKTFRRRPGCLLNVLCTFNLRPVSTGLGTYFLFVY